jgi:hypothetical protein
MSPLEISVTKVFITANMNNSKSRGKQEVDVQKTWKGETWYKSPCQSHISNIKSFLFFMFAVMKTFVTDISVSTGRNDFIFDMWLWHGDLYRVSPLQVYCTSQKVDVR